MQSYFTTTLSRVLLSDIPTTASYLCAVEVTCAISLHKHTYPHSTNLTIENTTVNTLQFYENQLQFSKYNFLNIR